MKRSVTAEELISALAEELELPDSRYEAADRSYRSFARWLERAESKFASTTLRVYTQGSFRLGTAIRPLNGDEHYDLDVVCEFEISRSRTTQQKLQDDLGFELAGYARSKQLEQPQRWDRCYTLNYADSAQFHMDVLPSIPETGDDIAVLASRNVSMDIARYSLAITDKKHPLFRTISNAWPSSNPNGYAQWFYRKMRPVLQKRATFSIAAEAEVSDIPTFPRKTPLQLAIQILKRHRDMHFADDAENRPSSIILTTLAAHAYGQQDRVVDGLYSILDGMDKFVEDRAEGFWMIPNPSDPRENFADGWRTAPQKAEAFFQWLREVRNDFSIAANLDSLDELIQGLTPRFGKEIIEKAASTRDRLKTPSTAITKSVTDSALAMVRNASHRQPPPWNMDPTRFADFSSATQSYRGFRPKPIIGGRPVQLGAELRFEVKTNVRSPFRVYWQIVNTGRAAEEKRDLRGGFEERPWEIGTLKKEETAAYPGSHSIQCFIVKDGACVARTQPLIIQIP